MRKLIATVLSFLAYVAQGQTGYTAVTNNSNNAEALLSSEAFAACIVKKRPEEARRVVVESIYNVSVRFPRLLDADCLPNKKSVSIVRMKFPSDTLHQMLSNALIRREYAVSGPTSFADVPDTPWPPLILTSPDELAKMSPADRAKTLESDKSRQTWRSLNVMAHCVARRSPDRVRMLALSAVDSADERLAVMALADDISACLPAGAKFKLRMVDVRGPTVRNYYILARYLVDSGSPVDERDQGV